MVQTNKLTHFFHNNESFATKKTLILFKLDLMGLEQLILAQNVI